MIFEIEMLPMSQQARDLAGVTMNNEVCIMPNTEFKVFKAAHKHVYRGSEYQAVD